MNVLRVMLFNLVFVLLTVTLGVFGLLVRAFRRDLAFGLARLWIRLTLAALRVVCGVRPHVVGREHLRAAALVVASQHRSAIDSLVWFTLVERPSYIMKQELRRIPLVGPLLEPAGMIAIDRAGGSQALRRMVRDARAALAAGRQLIVFPEGTRVGPDERAILAPGIVALAGLGTVVPVATNSGHVWGAGFLLRPGPLATDAIISIVVGPPLPAGLRREELLQRIGLAWSDSEAMFRPSACG